MKIIDPNEDILVCTYACKEGLGIFLLQNGHVICYVSKKLKGHEKNYATHNLELEATIHALKMWRLYLTGKRFELRNDHNGLKHLFRKPQFISRQIRWLEILVDYDFEFKHIKGKENKVANVPNKGAHVMHDIAIIIYKFDIKIRILEDRNSYHQYKEIKIILQKGKV